MSSACMGGNGCTCSKYNQMDVGMSSIQAYKAHKNETVVHCNIQFACKKKEPTKFYYSVTAEYGIMTSP